MQLRLTPLKTLWLKAVTVCANTGYINACLGAREWENKEGYVNNDLFLPKRIKKWCTIRSIRCMKTLTINV